MRYENSQRCLIKKNMMEFGRFDPKSFRYKLKSFRSINKVDSIHVDLRMDPIDFLRGSNRPVDGSKRLQFVWNRLVSKRLWMETTELHQENRKSPATHTPPRDRFLTISASLKSSLSLPRRRFNAMGSRI